MKFLKKLQASRAYRKDDRAMRAIYGCPENFRESLATPTATFPEIVNRLLLRSIILKLLKCVQNLKFVALPVPEIIGGPKKFRQCLDTPTIPFLQNFNGILFGWTKMTGTFTG